MPPRYRVNLTRESAAHLEEIFKYVETQSPQNAPRLIQRLLDAIFSLEQLPHRFKVVRNTSAGAGWVSRLKVTGPLEQGVTVALKKLVPLFCRRDSFLLIRHHALG